MVEGERKLCLVGVPLEIAENRLLQVQMQLLEAMEDGEALAAEEVLEALVEGVGGIHLLLVLIIINQEQMQVAVEREVMEAAAEQEEGAEMLLKALQEQEMQEVLAVLEEEVEAAEILGMLRVLMGDTIMAVMVQQEVMAEAEDVAAQSLAATMAVVLMVAAALAELD